MGVSEFLGQVLTAAAALFALAYEAPIVSFAVTFRGAVSFGPTPEAALGIAGLSVAALGSFVGITIGQVKRPGDNIGAALLFWVNFLVLLVGDVLFYVLQPSDAVTLLIGGVSGTLTALGLLIIVQRPQGPAGHQ